MLDTLERHPGVDLLLLDLSLPGVHGFSALAYLRGARVVVKAWYSRPPRYLPRGCARTFDLRRSDRGHAGG
jgi:CheY-like chemotaxis protein